MNHLHVLDPFFHNNGEGELVRDKTPKGNWIKLAKDLRLVRGFVLKATCRRRFLGWRTSIIELSEREIADFIGPTVLRLVSTREEENGFLFTKPMDIPLTKAAIQALDLIVGNDDGVLIRGAKDFSRSCSDVSLVRATLLMASLPKQSHGMNLCVVLLDEAELAALNFAEDQFRLEMEATKKLTSPSQHISSKTIPAPVIKPSKEKLSMFSCCMSKPLVAQQQQQTSRPSIGPISAVQSKPSFQPQIRRIGTAPPLPPLHKEAIGKVLEQTGMAASSDSLDASWKRIGALDGFTWMLKDGGKQMMVRGTVHAPIRAVFDFIWNGAMDEIDPRITNTKKFSKKDQLQFLSREYGKEWDGGSEVEIIRGYSVLEEGTVFLVETSGAGVVLSPASEFLCHVAWVETNLPNLPPNLAPWAQSRYNSLLTKRLAERLLSMDKFSFLGWNLESQNFQGAVINGEETEAPDGAHAAALEKRLGRIDFLTLKKQVENTMDFVFNAIPDQRQRYRTSFDGYSREVQEYIDSPRFSQLKQAAQYPYDCIVKWILANLPTNEAWVETLVEQVSLHNLEQQHLVDNGGDIGSHISQFMLTKELHVRIPSL